MLLALAALLRLEIDIERPRCSLLATGKCAGKAEEEEADVPMEPDGVGEELLQSDDFETTSKSVSNEEFNRGNSDLRR